MISDLLVTGLGWHFLLQRIFLTQGLNLGLLHCRQMLYCLSYQGSPNVSLSYLSLPFLISQPTVLTYLNRLDKERDNHSINSHYYYNAAATAAKSPQSCLTLCDPIDGSPPGSPIPGILQARTLEWVAISFSSVWKWKAKVKLLSHVRLLATPWTAAYQAPLPMGFSRQEYWSRLPLPCVTHLK